MGRSKYYVPICGAPFAGKRNLLISLSEKNSGLVFNKNLDSEKYINILSCEIKITNLCSIIFKTAPSHIFFQKETFTVLLQNADALIYSFSAVTDRGFANSPDDSIHENYFNAYHSIALDLHKSWLDIPWIIIINNINLKTVIPNSINLPKDLRNNAIKTETASGSGVDVLLQKTKIALNCT